MTWPTWSTGATVPSTVWPESPARTRSLVSSTRRATLWPSAPAALWTVSASTATGQCSGRQHGHWITSFLNWNEIWSRNTVTRVCPRSGHCEVKLAASFSNCLCSDWNSWSLTGWNKMNASVLVSAPWRSMSALATSPMLRTGRCRTPLHLHLYTHIWPIIIIIILCSLLLVSSGILPYSCCFYYHGTA